LFFANFRGGNHLVTLRPYLTEFLLKCLFFSKDDWPESAKKNIRNNKYLLVFISFWKVRIFFLRKFFVYFFVEIFWEFFCWRVEDPNLKSFSLFNFKYLYWLLDSSEWKFFFRSLTLNLQKNFAQNFFFSTQNGQDAKV